MKTKIDIFSGFLGAGKTTLIRRMIEGAYPGEKLVILENEFGDVAVDDIFLKDTGVKITRISSGCICCSMTGDFRASIRSIVEWMAPDRILLEPSGIGRLSDILNTLRQFCGEFVEVSGVVTVVDVRKFDLYLRNYEGYYDNQLEHTGCVILSRVDQVDTEDVGSITERIHGINPGATVITTPWRELSPAQIREGIENQATPRRRILQMEQMQKQEHHCKEHDCHEHHHHHHQKDSLFESWSKESPQKYPEKELSNILAKLSDREAVGCVLRAKGAVPSDQGGWLHFDFVPGETKIRSGCAAITGQICVIGSELNRTGLQALFHG